MNYGVVLPIRQLTIAEAEALATRAEEFQGAVDEVASDIQRARALGADWMTFDLPRAGVPAMVRAMERLAREVQPAAAQG